MSPPTPPPSLLDRLRRFDPTVLPIVVAAVVLVGAVIWLLGRPLPQPAATGPDPQTAQRLAQVDQLTSRVAALEGTAGRLAALEARPTPAAPDLAPLREAAAAADRRAAAAEERAAGVARDLAARPAVDPNALAPRAALEQLAQRVEALGRELQGADAQVAQRLGTLEGAVGAFAARIQQNEAGLAQRQQAIEQASARIAQLEQQLAARGQTIEQQAQRIAALEGAAQRLAALEGRSARMSALDAARAALDAGRPIGGALSGVQNVPEPLARFASAAPPTEAQLRLTFDEAARAGRAASEAPAGSTVLDSAVNRITGLVTVRRGEEMLWGDAAGAEIERARRALEAGDLEAALRHLQRLSPPAREAMKGWIGQAEALVAARAALRQLAAG